MRMLKKAGNKYINNQLKWCSQRVAAKEGQEVVRRSITILLKYEQKLNAIIGGISNSNSNISISETFFSFTQILCNP